MKSFTIKELEELSDLPYDTIEQACHRDSIKSHLQDGFTQVNIDSFLKYYPDVREKFLKNFYDKYQYHTRKAASGVKVHTSTIDPNKRMTQEEIEKVVFENFTQLETKVEKIAFCNSMREEFPTAKGLAHQSMYKKWNYQRVHGKEVGERKVRADRGKDKHGEYEWCFENFKEWFLKYFLSGSGDDNNYAGGNVMMSYRYAIMEIARAQGKPLPDYKECSFMKLECEKLLDKKIPGLSVAFKIAQNPIHLAARKYRLNKNRHYMETLPIHRWDNFRMYRFMECIQSDWHTLHEKYKIILPDGKESSRSYHIIIWVESKTNLIAHWTRHLGSPNGDRTVLSQMELLMKVGRADTWRYDNGMEFINARNMNSTRKLYSIQELKEFDRVTKAGAHKGWQKIPERIFKQLENLLKTSDGYSGSNRIVALHPELGTTPIAATHTLEEMDEIIGQIITTYNHEWITVNLKHADGLTENELTSESSEGTRPAPHNKIRVRRIDLYNAFRKKYTPISYTKDYLTMRFGIPEVLPVRNSCVQKAWCGERFSYMPSASDITTLLPYNGQQVEVRYDPTSEYSLGKMFVFEPETDRYITTVYCDLLNGYTKEQADDYKKAKAKINRFLRDLNEKYVFKGALDRALQMQLEKETPETTETKGKIIVWDADIARFNANRDTEKEVFHEMSDIRRQMSENDWTFLKSENQWLNNNTGEIVDSLPESN